MEQAASWLLAASSVAVYWMLGSKMRSGWVAGIVSEAGWVAYGLAYGQSGFAACAFVFAAVYWRNWRKWAPGVNPAPREGKRLPALAVFRPRRLP